jgi:P-type Ca2+ transporter type 2C
MSDSERKQYYSLPVNTVLSELKTSKDGITETEAASRIKIYGYNRLSEKKKTSAFTIYLNQFKNSLTIVLLAAVVLVFFVYFFGGREQSELIEAILILSIVLMITLLGFIQEYKAEKALESLKKLLSFKVTVRRNGEKKEIDVTYLVPGDIVILEEGLKIPADIRLLETVSLFVNESSLTGESTTVEKKIDAIHEEVQIADQKNMVFAGTAVSSGRGTGIVIRTGDATEIGKIAHLVATEVPDPTPLQMKLDVIGKLIGRIVIAISGIVFVFILFFAKEYSSLPLLQKIVQSFIAAVALAVAAIPEGLPAVVTISLAMGTQRMAKKNALVRKLNAVETLGSVDVICSDKTGTLTKNEMTVRQIFYNNTLYSVTGNGFETTGTFQSNGQSTDPKELTLILEAGMYANDATLTKESFLGDPTEVALLVSAAKAGITPQYERIAEVPFSSERKMMSVVLKKGDTYVVFTKGAPEMLINHCSYVSADPTPVKMEDSFRNTLSGRVEEMSAKALRVLGFSYKQLTAEEFEVQKHDPIKLEEQQIFIGLQGMIDPAREEVKPLIEQCKKSGIRVIMITGDHEITAKAIAREIGIEGDAITGNELEKISDEDFVKQVEMISIYARINPSAKMRIVQALKKNNHIVAMTGDGVNDAPALKKADIGIAMGIAGTDVAKEASEIVLLDDKFSTIVGAIEEGRGIFENIRKFVQYLLSCNIGEVILIFAGILLFQDLILTATMLLWINVVTDGLPAIALGMDKADKNIITLSPRKFQTEIITKKVWTEMFIFAVILTVSILGIYYMNGTGNEIEAKGAAFIAIAFFELAYLFVIRRTYGAPFFSNKWLLMAIAATIVMQVAIVSLPFLAEIFEVRHIDGSDWLYILTVTALIWLFFVKILKRNLLSY